MISRTAVLGQITGPLLGCLLERKIAPHIPVFGKSGRNDDTWTRADFAWDTENDQHICLDLQKDQGDFFFTQQLPLTGNHAIRQ
jgi:hypothetical protein